MPELHRVASASHTMARCECSEGMSRAARKVLEQDAVLLFWRKLLHCWVRCRGESKSGRGGGDFVHVQKQVILRRVLAHDNEKTEVETESMYEEGNTGVTSAVTDASLCCLLTVIEEEEGSPI